MKVAFLLSIFVTGMQAQGSGYGQGGTLPAGALPKIVQRVAPEYTTEALDAKPEGSVYLSTVIGIDGIRSDISVIKSLGKGLDEKAVECLKKWQFSPAT